MAIAGKRSMLLGLNGWLPLVCWLPWFFWAAEAGAMVFAEARAGYRSLEISQEGVNEGALGQVLQLGVRVDPVPVLPLSLTAAWEFSSGSAAGDFAWHRSSLGLVGGQIWVPLVPVVSPYIKVGWAVAGHVDFGGEPGAAGAVTHRLRHGFCWGGGVEWQPFFGAGLAIEMTAQRLRIGADPSLVLLGRDYLLAGSLAL